MPLGIEFEIDPSECSFCYLARVKRVAKAQHKIVTTSMARRGNHRKCKGFDIRVNGIKLYWTNKLPTHCDCEVRHEVAS